MILLSLDKKQPKKTLSSPLVIEPVHPGSSSILLVQEHPVEVIAERENNSFVVIETHQKTLQCIHVVGQCFHKIRSL